MAASEFSFEFVPSYVQLIEHTYVVCNQFITEMMNSNYSFPSTTVSDLKKYCRFDLGDIILIIIMTIIWTVLRWITTESVFKVKPSVYITLYLWNWISSFWRMEGENSKYFSRFFVGHWRCLNVDIGESRLDNISVGILSPAMRRNCCRDSARWMFLSVRFGIRVLLILILIKLFLFWILD